MMLREWWGLREDIRERVAEVDAVVKHIVTHSVMLNWSLVQSKCVRSKKKSIYPCYPEENKCFITILNYSLIELELKQNYLISNTITYFKYNRVLAILYTV